MTRRPSSTPRPVLPARALVLFCACFLLLFAPSASAGKPHGRRASRDEILQLEDQWRQAQLAGDVGTMEKLLADDYLGINSFGQALTKEQQLDRMRTRKLLITNLTVSEVKVKLISQHAAIVTSLVQLQGTSDDRPLNGQFRYTRIYQRLPSGLWKISNFESTRVPGPESQVH